MIQLYKHHIVPGGSGACQHAKRLQTDVQTMCSERGREGEGDVKLKHNDNHSISI